MVIVTDGGPNVHTYLDSLSQLTLTCPSTCPVCHHPGKPDGHGVYYRKVWDQAGSHTVPIKRWVYRACGHTLSMLPSFLLPYRHYELAVIESIMSGRYEQGRSLNELAQTVSRRTVLRWLRAYGDNAGRWLAQVQQTLAQHNSASPVLDPLGESAGPVDTPRALLNAALHLLAWAKTCWSHLADYGWREWLRFLWHWGHGQGLGRLI